MRRKIDLLALSDGERLKYLCGLHHEAMLQLYYAERALRMHPRVFMTFARAFREMGMGLPPGERFSERFSDAPPYDYMIYTHDAGKPVSREVVRILQAPIITIGPQRTPAATRAAQLRRRLVLAQRERAERSRRVVRRVLA